MKSDWTLLDFKPGEGDCTRVYTFQRLQVGQRETRAVEVDPAAARGRGILLQELPNLCRRLVEDGRVAGAKRFQVTEADMVAFRDRRTAAAKPQPVAETGETKLKARLAEIMRRA